MSYKNDTLTDYFEALETMLKYKQWYFGHYHQSGVVDDLHTVLYKEIIPIE